ncbi:hypothetical protein Hanom_Chr10g00886091 [Helianthus anomalus]
MVRFNHYDRGGLSLSSLSPWQLTHFNSKINMISYNYKLQYTNYKYHCQLGGATRVTFAGWQVQPNPGPKILNKPEHDPNLKIVPYI